MQSYESLANLHLDDLAEKVGGRYRLTYIVSQRLRAINAGAPLLVEKRENEAAIAAVCREVAEGKIWLEVPEKVELGEEADFDVLGLEGDEAF